MKKTSYGFSAPYWGVDFSRIVEENPNTDFIRVEWQNERGHARWVIIVTPKGRRRCCAVWNETRIKYGLWGITPRGDIDFGVGPRALCYFSGDLDDFEKWYGELREREERRRPIKVTAIV
jgi:hypothetical protein